MKEATYTFVSVSTAKQGMLDELVEIATAPTRKMDDKVPGLLAYQVSVDRDRNSAIVWATFDTKDALYNFLETEQGKDDHGENESMESIATFQMYDCEPMSARLESKESMKMKEATYTFVSVSTAKQGMLDELVEIATAPTRKMDDKVSGLLAYQVSVDRSRNSAIVWATFDTKESLYNFLETEQGKDDHGENESMESIATFQMYDCEPMSSRLEPKEN